MSENEIIEQLEIEETNLVVHTQLCHLRYNQLTTKLNQVSSRLTHLEKLLVEVKENISALKLTTQKEYFSAAYWVISVLLGTLGFMIAKFVIT